MWDEIAANFNLETDTSVEDVEIIRTLIVHYIRRPHRRQTRLHFMLNWKYESGEETAKAHFRSNNLAERVLSFLRFVVHPFPELIALADKKLKCPGWCDAEMARLSTDLER